MKNHGFFIIQIIQIIWIVLKFEIDWNLKLVQIKEKFR